MMLLQRQITISAALGRQDGHVWNFFFCAFGQVCTQERISVTQCGEGEHSLKRTGCMVQEPWEALSRVEK